jgi:hypothetical protein
MVTKLWDCSISTKAKISSQSDKQTNKPRELQRVCYEHYSNVCFLEIKWMYLHVWVITEVKLRVCLEDCNGEAYR